MSSKEKCRTKKQIIKDCVKQGAITQAEANKIERSLYDSKCRGKAPTFAVVSQMFEKALDSELSTKKQIKDKNGNIIEITTLGSERTKLLYLAEISNIKKPYINDPNSLNEAIDSYMAVSLKFNVPLSVNGLAVALGVNRQTLKNWHEGRTRTFNKDIIDRAFALIDTQTELDIREGKKNVVGQIFLAKNDSGYVDEQKVSIGQDKIDDLTQEDIASKYADIIDIDTTEKKA